MIQKRYEYLSKDGKKWTPWFNTALKNFPNEQWQLNNKLRNEYRNH